MIAQHRKWISIEDSLPPFNTDVLVLVEREPLEIHDTNGNPVDFGDNYYHFIGRLRPQFRTERPFWTSAWDGEPIELEDRAVTYWMPLPPPPA